MKYLYDLTTKWVNLIFIVLRRNIFAAHLKHSSFGPLSVVKPVQNDLVHAMPCQCLFALSVCILQYPNKTTLLQMGYHSTN
jgi:hypothetical protein